MKVRFSREALADIDEIITYVAARNPTAANDLLAKLKFAADLLSQNPFMGALTIREGFRRLIIGKYLMVYEIAETEIAIIYVRHSARKPLDF